MALVKRKVLGILAQLVDLCIVEVFAGSDIKHFCTVGSGQELTLAVKQFQSVPLTGVV